MVFSSIFNFIRAKFKTKNNLTENSSRQAEKRRRKKFFTIIELLIVIAVIGILAGIIFVASGPARTKAKDTRIKTALAQIQNQAEQVYLSERSYSKVCCSGASCDAKIQALCNEIAQLQGSPLIYNDAAGKYCAAAQLSSKTFCIDSSGTAEEVAAAGNCAGVYTCACVLSYDFNKDGATDCKDAWLISVCAMLPGNHCAIYSDPIAWTCVNKVNPCPPTCPQTGNQIALDVYDIDCNNAINLSDVIKVMQSIPCGTPVLPSPIPCP